MKLIRTKVNEKFLFVKFDECSGDQMNEFVCVFSHQMKNYNVIVNSVIILL